MWANHNHSELNHIQGLIMTILTTVIDYASMPCIDIPFLGHVTVFGACLLTTTIGWLLCMQQPSNNNTNNQ